MLMGTKSLEAQGVDVLGAPSRVIRVNCSNCRKVKAGVASMKLRSEASTPGGRQPGRRYACDRLSANLKLVLLSLPLPLRNAVESQRRQAAGEQGRPDDPATPIPPDPSCLLK